MSMFSHLDLKIELARKRAEAERAAAWPKPTEGLTKVGPIAAAEAAKNEPKNPPLPVSKPLGSRNGFEADQFKDVEVTTIVPSIAEQKKQTEFASLMEAIDGLMETACGVPRIISAQAPPLGIMPAAIFYAKRLDELRSAILRVSHERGGKEVPEAWIAEVAELEAVEIPSAGQSEADAFIGLTLLKRAMAADPDYARTWHDNIAMMVHDAMGDGWHQGRRDARHLGTHVADRLMSIAFDVKSPTMAGEWTIPPDDLLAEKRAMLQDLSNQQASAYLNALALTKMPTSQELADDLRSYMNHPTKF